MVIVKLIRDTDGGIAYLRNTVRYVANARKAIAFGGFGVDDTDPEFAFRQMCIVKKRYHQTSMNPLLHFVVSFDGACNNERFAVQAAPYIAEYFADEYQLMWCVHCKDKKDAHYHMHILLNSVNVVNGKLIRSARQDVHCFAIHVKRITGMLYRVVFEPVK